MKTIKIIDLFIKIANGGKTPKKIKYNGKILNLDNSKELRYRFENDTFLSWDYFIENRLLTDEVEIIEDAEVAENKEIKKMGILYTGINSEIYGNFAIKINELIDAVNKLNKK